MGAICSIGEKYLIGLCLGNCGETYYNLVVKIDSRADGEILAEDIEKVLKDLSGDCTGKLDKKMKEILSDYEAYVLTLPMINGDCLIKVSESNEDIFSYTEHCSWSTI